jgi:hypothetical protein
MTLKVIGAVAALAATARAQAPLQPLDGGELATIKAGARAFSDRPYALNEWGWLFDGMVFLRASITNARFKVLSPGYVMVATPQAGERSQVALLSEQGFEPVDIEPFRPITFTPGKDGALCALLQKRVEAGQTVSFGYFGLALWSAVACPTREVRPLPFSITPPNPPNEGILFVDHAKNSRSGHLGHALVEYGAGKILAFYPNCSDDNNGHSAVGWIEFKRSEDAGQTWGDPQELPFSKELFLKHEGKTAMAEKAVVTSSGEIVLFYLICDVSQNALWQPYWTPLFSRSADGGRTWSEPQPVCSSRGRVYDAEVQDGEIRVLHFANDATVSWTGTAAEHVFELHVSSDGGKTFFKRSVLPFSTRGRGYGTLGLLKSGELIAFVYNKADETTLDYASSADGGRTWSRTGTARFGRKIRNPQFIAFDGKFFMHGRSGAYGEDSGHMILYTSADGLTWDEGVYLRKREAGQGAYSNSIVVRSTIEGGAKRLLIQASHAYRESRTNVLHWWLEESPAH